MLPQTAAETAAETAAQAALKVDPAPPPFTGCYPVLFTHLNVNSAFGNNHKQMSDQQNRYCYGLLYPKFSRPHKSTDVGKGIQLYDKTGWLMLLGKHKGC